MKIVRSVREMQAESDKIRRAGHVIGFVPTMGFLHEGHLNLLRIAREKADRTILSIFVNPTRFGPNEDLNHYPRDIERDETLAEEAGCDILFYPPVEEMYPAPFRTAVTVAEITQVLCGISRPTHFRGVTTIVAKLFNIVKPHFAVFGQKDAQQLIVIKQMVRDLNFDIDIITGPIVREADGLAMSSRNVYLSPEERKEAVMLYKSLMAAKTLIDSGERNADAIRAELERRLRQAKTAKIDYAEIVDTQNLKPLETIQGEILIALAVFFGRTRLIDNIQVSV